MKILVIETIASKPHLETAGEIALKFKKKKQNNEVKFSWLGYNLPWTDWQIPNIFRLLGGSYEKRISQFKKLLENNNIEICKNIEIGENKIFKWSHSFSGNINALKKFKYENKPLGMGVASSCITFFQDKNFHPKKKIRLVRTLLFSSAVVYERCKKLLLLENPKLIITFNNRFATSLPIIIAAKEKKIKILRHERASTFDKYILYKYNINDPRNFSNIYKEWKSIKNNKKYTIAKKYFNDKLTAKHYDEMGLNYTQSQKKDLLPKLPKNKRIVVYYTSTDYENSAYIDLKFDQKQAFEKLYKAINQIEDLHLVIKLHPTLKNRDHGKADEKKWLKYQNKNTTVILSNEKFSTYSLMFRADIICAYHSRIIIESAYFSKPTIGLIKFGWPNGIGIEYPSNITDLKKILNKKYKFKKINKDKCLAVGHYYATYGEKFKYYKPINYTDGFFLSKKLEWKSKKIKILEYFGFKKIYYLIKFFLKSRLI
jgi:hypothetical protein